MKSLTLSSLEKTHNPGGHTCNPQTTIDDTNELKYSGICCKVYRTPNTPLGYTDDLAACCLGTHTVDKVLGIVYNLRYTCNNFDSKEHLFSNT